MSNWKFTSCTLLALTAFAALGLASMRVGGILAAITVGSVAIFATGLTIVAFIDRFRRRAFAIGFLVPFFAYVGVHTFAGGNQLNPFEHSAFPTTRSFGTLYLAIRTVTWTDTATGKVIPNYDSAADPSSLQMGGGGGFGGQAVQFSQTPNQETFTLVAHSLIVVILGIIGANFATYVYRTQAGG